MLVAIEEIISKSTKMDFSLKFILLTYLIISIEGKPQNHNGGQSHNGGIEGNDGNFVSNIIQNLVKKLILGNKFIKNRHYSCL